MATGQRTLLQTIDPTEKAGLATPIRLAYAERSKSYAYCTIRVMGNLYVVEGLEQETYPPRRHSKFSRFARVTGYTEVEKSGLAK